MLTWLLAAAIDYFLEYFPPFQTKEGLTLATRTSKTSSVETMRFTVIKVASFKDHYDLFACFILSIDPTTIKQNNLEKP